MGETDIKRKIIPFGVCIFADDVSDHCIVGAIRDTKMPRSKT